MSGSIVITGRSYGRRATLEVTGDALTWRARRGTVDPLAENIATTTEDVSAVHWLERRLSPGGAVLTLASLFWMVDTLVYGVATLCLGILMLAYRAARPRRFLAMDIRDRRLVLQVDTASATDARALAGRIERRLLTGETLERPLALP